MRVATRGSALAQRQAAIVIEALRSLDPRVSYSVEIISTQGDDQPQQDASEFEGQGIFVRRIEAALLQGRADIAVHSFKDMPSTPTPGLSVAAFPAREDPRDALVTRDAMPLDRLPAGARVGTASPRRRVLLNDLRRDLEVTPIRGNVDTRLRRVAEGDVDAVVVAAAGLRRLGREAEITETLDPLVFTPAAGQGILAVQVCEGDHGLLDLISALDDPVTRACALAERAVARAVGAGCQTPLGAYARVVDGHLEVVGALGNSPGTGVFRARATGQVSTPETPGTEVGAALRAQSIGETR